MAFWPAKDFWAAKGFWAAIAFWPAKAVWFVKAVWTAKAFGAVCDAVAAKVVWTANAGSQVHGEDINTLQHFKKKLSTLFLLAVSDKIRPTKFPKLCLRIRIVKNSISICHLNFLLYIISFRLKSLIISLVSPKFDIFLPYLTSIKFSEGQIDIF